MKKGKHSKIDMVVYTLILVTSVINLVIKILDRQKFKSTLTEEQAKKLEILGKGSIIPAD